MGQRIIGFLVAVAFLGLGGAAVFEGHPEGWPFALAGAALFVYLITRKT